MKGCYEITFFGLIQRNTFNMSNLHQGQISKIETVVKLYGDPEENIKTILQNMKLSPTQMQNIKTVLSILYSKMQKLRQERNDLRLSLYQIEQMLIQSRHQNESLKTEAELQKKHMQNMAVKTVRPDQYTFDFAENNVDMTPPLKETYMSVQLNEDKQNRPSALGEIRYVSSFEPEHNKIGQEYLSLMKKYNFTPEQLKKVIVLYLEEEKKVLEKLETESQRQLYLQGKKTKNYHDWFKKMKKERVQGNKMGSSLSSFLSDNDFK